MTLKNNHLFLILVGSLLNACISVGDSSNESIEESLNGDGKKALLFIKYGGATVNNSLQVSIMQEGDEIKGDAVGNVFIVDDSNGTVARDDVKIGWKNADTLEVFYDKRLRIFKNEQHLNGVTIWYKRVE